MNNQKQPPYQSFDKAIHNDTGAITLKGLKTEYLTGNRYKAGSLLDKVFWLSLSKIIQQSKNYTTNTDIIEISFYQDDEDTNISGNTSPLSLSFSVKNIKQSSNLKEIKKFFEDNNISSFKDKGSFFLIDIDGGESTNVNKLDNLIKTSNDRLSECKININDSNNSSKQTLFTEPQPSYGATKPPTTQNEGWTWKFCNIL